MRRTVVQFVAVVLTAILAIAGCCAACASDTSPKKASAHDCCPSNHQAPKKQVPPQHTANCPQCLENRYAAPQFDSAATIAEPVDAVFVPTTFIAAAHAPITHAPPLIAESALYLRLNTLLI